MATFINGIGIISPQQSFGDIPFLEAPNNYSGNRLACIEPDYNGWIDARSMRRMSRIIRMGVAAAACALKEAAVDKPAAIITGTAFGCLDDTGTFLHKIIDHHEEALNPTPFIQSTHNTIGSQVALLLQCYGYNQTYSHRAFSFEHALVDAIMMIEERGHDVLVGGVDEITDLSFDIMNRFDSYKQMNGSSLELFKDQQVGFIQGEGAAYFSLAGMKSQSTYACVRDVATFYKTDNIADDTALFLERNRISPGDVQLVLTGKNGDYVKDKSYDDFMSRLFPHAVSGVFKHLCGEYQTSNAFAMWIAARMLKENKIPPVVVDKNTGQQAIKRILIYNRYMGKHHSLILLESC